jgi:hypothetical protein
MNYSIELFDFQFSEIIQQQISVLNSVLNDLGRLPLFENADFTIDRKSAGTFFLRICLSNLKNSSIPVDILLEGDRMRLDIFHLSESFEWSKNEVNGECEKIKSFFKELFTSYILIESCDAPYKKSQMYFFNENGDLINKYKLRGLVHIFSEWNYDKKLFLPIYSV